MTVNIQVDPVPLRQDEYGVIRVGKSRVPLDVVIDEYKVGTYPEEIARGYSTLELADVYAVISYYLRHQEELDRYFQARQEHADRLRQEIEATNPERRAELRAKLLARKAQVEEQNASPSK